MLLEGDGCINSSKVLYPAKKNKGCKEDGMDKQVVFALFPK